MPLSTFKDRDCRSGRRERRALFIGQFRPQFLEQGPCSSQTIGVVNAEIVTTMLIYNLPSLLGWVPLFAIYSEAEVTDLATLFCPADLPPGEYGLASWLGDKAYSIERDIDRMAAGFQSTSRKTWSRLNFTSLTDLCSWDGNPKGNLHGAVC